MAKTPRPLTKQIEIVEETIKNLNGLIDTDKIKIEYYGKDFLEPLSEIRQEALALRSKLEVFKTNMEYALTSQFHESARFASVNKVVDSYLSKS